MILSCNLFDRTEEHDRKSSVNIYGVCLRFKQCTSQIRVNSVTITPVRSVSVSWLHISVTVHSFMKVVFIDHNPHQSVRNMNVALQ
jgi:hypothetical protein